METIGGRPAQGSRLRPEETLVSDALQPSSSHFNLFLSNVKRK